MCHRVSFFDGTITGGIMQSTNQDQLQILLHDVAIKAEEEGCGYRYTVYYQEHRPLAAVSIWLLSKEPRPAVQFMKIDDLQSVKASCMPQIENGHFATLLLDDSKVSSQYDVTSHQEVIALLQAMASYQKKGVHLGLMDFLAKKTEESLYITSSHRLSLADLYLWQVIRGQNFRWRRYSASFGPVLESWLFRFEGAHSPLVDEVSKELQHEFDERSSPKTFDTSSHSTSMKNFLRESNKFYQPLRKEASVGNIRCSVDDQSVKPSWWSETK